MPPIRSFDRSDAGADVAPAVPIVALHSSGAGARQWAPWRSLWPQAATVATPDLIGYGADGSVAPTEAVTLDDEARRIADLCAAFEQGVHLVGHSYGGAVALRVALRWPRRVRALSLYEPVLFALLRGHDDAAWHHVTTAGHEIGALARDGALAASAACFVDYWSGPGAWDALPAPRQRAVAERMPKVAAEFGALFADDVAPAAYTDLHVPVHLLAGTRSPQPARRVAQRLAALMPRARLTTLHGLGHMGPLEDAPRVADAFGFVPARADASALT